MVGEVLLGAGAFPSGSVISRAGQTTISLSNPAAENGVVTEFYSNTGAFGGAQGIFFGVFYGAGTTYSCREYVYIGDVSYGIKTVTGLEIPIQAGDMAGIFYSSGNFYYDGTGGHGSTYRYAGNALDGSEYPYVLFANQAIAFGGGYVPSSSGAGRLIGSKSRLIGGPSPLIGGPSPLIG